MIAAAMELEPWKAKQIQGSLYQSPQAEWCLVVSPESGGLLYGKAKDMIVICAAVRCQMGLRDKVSDVLESRLAAT